MQKFITFISTLILIPFAGFSQVPTNGLVGSWLFSGNANDGVGTNHGTVSGATLVPDRCGNPNSAYSFNGSSDYILMLSPGPTGTVSRSISFWAKTTNTVISPVAAFDYGSSQAQGGSAFEVVWNYCSPGYGLDNSTQAVIKGYNCLLNGDWHHLVVVYDATVSPLIGNLQFYVDGNLLNAIACNISGTNTAINTTSYSPITIGRAAGFFSRYFNGALDDYYVYNRALTPAEILQLYTVCPRAVDGNTLVCPGSSYIYTVNPVLGTSYTWVLPPGWSGSSTGNTITVTAGSTAGNITVNYTVAACSYTGTATLPVAISNQTISTTANRKTLCKGEKLILTASGAATYTWQPGNITGASVTLAPVASTVYTVTPNSGTASCISKATVSVTVNPCIGLDLEKRDPVFSIYPNPTEGHFVLRLNRQSSVTILNQIGQVVYCASLPEGEHPLDLSGKAAGIYFLKANNEWQTQVLRLVKE